MRSAPGFPCAGCIYGAERIAALPGVVTSYNGYRPHGGLGGDTPLGRLTASTTS